MGLSEEVEVFINNCSCVTLNYSDMINCYNLTDTLINEIIDNGFMYYDENYDQYVFVNHKPTL